MLKINFIFNASMSLPPFQPYTLTPVTRGPAGISGSKQERLADVVWQRLEWKSSAAFKIKEREGSPRRSTDATQLDRTLRAGVPHPPLSRPQEKA
jgi:hypothetical protein